jgi:endonuclease I
MKNSLLLILVFLSFTTFSQQNYYNGIDFSKNGTALKNDLAVRIINTHRKFLSYTPDIWNACKSTDVNPNNSSEVLLIYGFSSSGTSARTRAINKNGGNVGDWNREHTYPKSLGNPNLGTSGAGADAHHLRPSDVQYNGQRGSKKFVNGSGNSRTVSGGWFPGDEWKGDVARMMMYMYLRYGNQCKPNVVGIGSSANTPDDMIDLFLKWNAEDPVSAFEDNRNNYHGNPNNTYAQGNRNPFIDNPYLATKIWGNPPSITQQPTDRWGTLNVSKNNVSQLSTYPNPVKGDTLFFNKTDSYAIEVYNLIGKKVFFKQVFNANKIDISSIKNGIYILKLSNNNKILTKKFIKE